MKLDPAYVNGIARPTGFDAPNLEKVVRLRQLLIEFFERALMEWYLGYDDHMGTFDQIQVEINFLMRVCALPPKVLRAVSIGNEETCDFPVLAVEELFGEKIKARIDRRHPRDLYDLFRFGKAGLLHDSEVMRKLAILFSSTMDTIFEHTAQSVSRKPTIGPPSVFLIPIFEPEIDQVGPKCSPWQTLFYKVFWITRASTIFSKRWRWANTNQTFDSPCIRKSSTESSITRHYSGKPKMSLGICHNGAVLTRARPVAKLEHRPTTLVSACATARIELSRRMGSPARI